MKNPKRVRITIIKRLISVSLAVGILASTPHVYNVCKPKAKLIVEKVSLISAALTLPDGGVEYFKAQVSPDKTVVKSNTIPIETPQTTTVTTTTPPTTTVPTTTPAPTTAATVNGNMKKVKETQIKNTGLNYQNIWVKKQTKNKTIDIKTELERKPDFKIQKNTDKPQVLLIHTHTSECYMDSYTGYYDSSFSPRSTDKSKNVVRVAQEIYNALDSNGISVVHATTFHDYPKYNGAYSRAEQTIDEYLKKYPSIKVVLDIHRDAMQYEDGTKVKPTAVINGKKAAQVMIISGCDDEDKLNFPDWEHNMRLAVRLQKSMADKYPGLARPILFPAFRYNMHKTHGSLLVEFGTDANTLDEAIYSAQLFSQSLVEVLNSLT